MSDWTELSISDIAEINPRESLPKGKISKKVAMDFLLPFTKRISGFTLEEYKGGTKFRNGDTLLARITPCLENGKTAFVDILDDNEIGFGSTEYIVLREKKNISDKNFLYYLATSPEIRDIAILSMTGSSGRQRVQTDEVIQYKILTPPLPEQKAIADVLSSLDDKIDLLQRQNKTLEQLAQTLFRQWFIEEAQDEWKEGKLGDVINIFDSKRVPLSKMQRDKMKTGKLYPYYGAATIMDYINEYIFDGEYILLGEDGTVRTNEGFPILQYARGKFWVNNHTHIFQARKPYSNFLIYCYLQQKNIDEIVTGAVQPKINQTNLNNLEFPIAPKSVIERFNNKTESIFAKIHNNEDQIRTLETLRDTLLPKLISGEIRVKF